MKLVVLAFLVGLALRATSYQFGSLKPSSGKQHLVYRYQVQLATGSPETSQLWSGLKLNADLHLKINNLHVVAQLKKLSLQKMDKFLPENGPLFFMQGQSQLLDGIEADMNSQMIQPLQQPFSFQWSEGQVEAATFVSWEPLFSMNIKKGLLNLLHVDMRKLFSVGVVRDKSDNVNGQKESYTVLEPSPYGECLTRYTPQMVPGPLVPDTFYLNKVRNYSSCYQKPPMVLSFDNLNSGNNQSTDHLNQQAQVKYGIKGNIHNFIIDHAIGQSKVIFVPLARQDGSIQTSINQTLFLVGQKGLAQSLPTIQGRQQSGPEALAMTMPVERNQDLRPYTLRNTSQWTHPQAPSPWSIAKMDQLLTLVANGTHEYPSSHLLPATQALTEMIRQSNKQTLQKLFSWEAFRAQPQQETDQQQGQQQQQQQQAVSQLKKKVLWNLLMHAGTSTASEVALESCSEHPHLQSHQDCVMAVIAIGLYTPPSEAIVFDLLNLMKANAPSANRGDEDDNMGPEDSQEQRQQTQEERDSLFQVSGLALGSVLGRGEQSVQDIKKFVEQRLKVIRMIKDQFSSQDSDAWLKKSEKELLSGLNLIQTEHHQLCHQFLEEMEKHQEGLEILLLKSLRNAHLPLSLPIISRYLARTHEAPVRIAAAQALETFTCRKEEIHKILEKIVKDPLDKVSVRIQAFRSMVNTQAPVYRLLRLADSISYEKEKQLSTYVWSVFSRMANSTFRPYRQSAAHFRDAMALMQPLQPGWQDSHYHSWQQDLARELTVLQEGSLVTGPDFLNNMDLSSTVDIFGTSSKSFQVTVVTEGLQKILRSMMGPRGFLTKGNSLMDLLQRPKRDVSEQDQKIQRIFEQLKVQARDIPSVKAFADLQIMNRVVRIYTLTHILQNLDRQQPFIVADIKESRVKAGLPLSLESAGICHEFHMQMPTESGFPVSLQMGVTFSIKVNGSASAQVHSSVYRSVRNGLPPVKLEAHIALQPRLVAAATGKMSVDGYLIQTGSLFESLLTAQPSGEATVAMDLLKNRVTARIAPSVSSDRPVTKLELKPYLYSLALSSQLHHISGNDPYRSINETNNRPIFITMQPVTLNQGAQLKQVNWELGQADVGYQVKIQGQYPVKSLQSSSTCPMMGRAHFAVFLDSGMDYPPGLSADIRYISHRRYRQEACDSWFPWQCYSRDENSPAPDLPEPTSPQYSMGQVRDIPDLGSDISLHQLKADIMETVGQEMPKKSSKTEWGVIAVLNGSSSTVVKGVAQSWHQGQQHRVILCPNIGQEACDSWFPWQCYSRDENSPAPDLPEPTSPQYSMGQVRDIPDLGSDISLHQLKADIMETVGQEMPKKSSKTEWGVIAVLNGSSSTVVKGVAQSWHQGQYLQSLVTILHRPDPRQPANQWKMSIKNSAIYPRRKYNVRDLLDPAYQLKVQDKIYQHMQRKEHKIINKSFQNLLFNLVSRNVIRNLPSMNPEDMLDRLMPEFVVRSKAPYVIQVRRILKTLLPLAHQLKEMHREMSDPFVIQIQQNLLKAKQREVIDIQEKVQTLIEKAGTEHQIARPVIMAIEYSVLKLSQAVLHLQDITQRAVWLQLVDNTKQMAEMQGTIDDEQAAIYESSMGNFGSKQNSADPEQDQTDSDSEEDVPIGYGDLDSSAFEDQEAIVQQQPIPQEEIIPSLKALTEHQLTQIRDMWNSLISQQDPEHNQIQPLIQNTADNVTLINNAIQQSSLKNNETIKVLMIQASIQHQILVHMLRACRSNNSDSNVDSFDRYSIKVQTKQLLERGSILEHQKKTNLICSPYLNISERISLKELQQIDRQLLALQQNHIRLPTSEYPWTTDSDNLASALRTLDPILGQLRTIRDKMLKTQSTMPHPCLLAKLVDTASSFQDRVGIFKRTLLAQNSGQTEWTREYTRLDDDSMDFVLSLSSVFDIYSTANSTDKEDIFPKGQILISQSLLDISQIRQRVQEVEDTMNQYLDQPYPMDYDQVAHVLRNTADTLKRQLSQLKEASKALGQAARTTSSLTAAEVYAQFLKGARQLTDIYTQIESYLMEYPSLRSELEIQCYNSWKEHSYNSWKEHGYNSWKEHG
ncbi:uncharacterized protein LOC143293109 [Babylonia areolata]|uniref:uncharacterized protein LOC143293109 n=1 Tax=Babylonia areolata TaxID=304850 RepID=UPI003FD1813E